MTQPPPDPEANKEAWAAHDATLLLEKNGPFPFKLLIDQGTDDKFLAEQLKPTALEVRRPPTHPPIYSFIHPPTHPPNQQAACLEKGQNLTIRMQEGYDHSYFTHPPTHPQAACLKKGQDLTIRMQEGYDHSYFFISTFIGEHIDFHADALGL